MCKWEVCRTQPNHTHINTKHKNTPHHIHHTHTHTQTQQTHTHTHTHNNICTLKNRSFYPDFFQVRNGRQVSVSISFLSSLFLSLLFVLFESLCSVDHVPVFCSVLLDLLLREHRGYLLRYLFLFLCVFLCVCVCVCVGKNQNEGVNDGQPVNLNWLILNQGLRKSSHATHLRHKH